MATGFDVAGDVAVADARASSLLRICAAAAMALASLLLASCHVYSARSIAGRVIDAETGRGIAGAIVVAAWELKGGSDYGQVTGYANVFETVTDATGRFEFPGWGPKLSPSRGRLRNGAPWLFVFKVGYRYSGFSNLSTDFAPSETFSYWDGKSLPLRKDPIPSLQSRDTMISVATAIGSLIEHGHVSTIARFACAVASEDARLRRYDLHGGPVSVEELARHGVDCSKAPS